jgi:6-phosphogluconolactonase (cycloisomerase 2 family)
MRSRIRRIRLLALLAALAALVAAPAARGAQPLAHVYAAANGDAQIDAFAAGPNGALAALGAPTPAGGPAAGLALARDGRSLYVADQLGHTVSQFDVADDGTLTPKDPATVDAGEAPFGVAVAPDGAHVYVTDQATGDVTVFDVGPSGELARASTAAADEGAVSIALTPDGTSAYVASVAGGSISQFAVTSDGSLVPRGRAAVPAGAAPSAVAVAPDGDSAYATDESVVGRVLQYDVGADGALTPKTPAFVAAGSSPAAVVATADSVYAANFRDGTLSQYDAGSDGALTAKTAPPLAVGVNPSALALAPDGASLFVADYGADRLSQYDVGDGGALAQNATATVATGARPIALAARAAPDVTAPTVDLVTPADGATYGEDDTVLADFSCADDGPSGLARCEGTVPDGDPLDTSAAGEHEFVVVARDHAGHETRVTHRYTVTGAPPEPGLPAWAGFAWPVSELPAVNEVRAGRPAPVRFRLDGADGVDAADVLADGSPSSVRVDCADPGEPTVGEPAQSVDDVGLEWRGDSTFRFVWQTDRAWAGTCRMLLVELRDRSVHRALYAFTWR